MQLSQLQRKEYRQSISQLTVSSHLLFFTVLLTGSTPNLPRKSFFVIIFSVICLIPVIS